MNRRNLLSFAALSLLCGCKEEKASAPLPVPFQKHDRCHLCGMVLSHYEGPKAELFLKNIEEPIKFCSVRDAFTFALQPENARRIVAFYVHCLDEADWNVLNSEKLIPAAQAFYVYGSEKEGVMGSEPFPFESKEKAEEFSKKFGGRILAYPQITLKVLEGDK